MMVEMEGSGGGMDDVSLHIHGVRYCILNFNLLDGEFDKKPMFNLYNILHRSSSN